MIPLLWAIHSIWTRKDRMNDTPERSSRSKNITINESEYDRLIKSQKLLQSLRCDSISKQAKLETLWIVDDLSRLLEVLSKMDVNNRLACKARDYVVEKAIDMIIEIILKEIK